MIREVNMIRKPFFTEEQIRILAENPYTRRVGEHSISFTPEFLRDVCRMREQNMTYRQIVEAHGYDPDMIGTRRIYHLGEIIRGKTANDFPDKRPVRSKVIGFDQKSDKRAMKQMQHEILYLRQEVEFLKKIMAAGVIESEDD